MSGRWQTPGRARQPQSCSLSPHPQAGKSLAFLWPAVPRARLPAQSREGPRAGVLTRRWHRESTGSKGWGPGVKASRWRGSPSPFWGTGRPVGAGEGAGCGSREPLWASALPSPWPGWAPADTPPLTSVAASGAPGRQLGSAFSSASPLSLQYAPENTLPTPMVLQR